MTTSIERAKAIVTMWRCMNREEAARYIGLGTTMFDQLVKDGRMPEPIRIGSRTIWDIHSLDAAFDRLADQREDKFWPAPVL